MSFKRLRTTVALAIVCVLAFPSSTWAAVYGYVPNGNGNTVSVIDLDDNEVVATVALEAGDVPTGITINGTGAYVVNNGSDTVRVIDLETNTVVDTIDVSGAPQLAASSGTGVYISTTQSNRIDVIDVRTNTVVKTINVGSTPIGIMASGTGVFVSNNVGDSLSIIDVTTNTLERTVSVGNGPLELAASGTGVYVVNGLDDSVSVIDVTMSTGATTIAVGDNPFGIATSGTGIFVTNVNDDTITVIDTTTNTAEGTINIAVTPDYISTRGEYLYVSRSSDDRISVVDISSRTVTDTIITGDLPRMLAFGSDLVTPEIAFQSGSLAVAETEGAIAINLTLSGSAAFDVSIPFTVAGTATSGSDYSLTTASPLVLENGETSTGLLLTILNDSTVEGSETIVFTLGSPTNAGTGSTVTHIVTISSDDAASSSSSSSSESNRGGGTREVTLEMKQEAAQLRFGQMYGTASSGTSSSPAYFSDVPSSAWFYASVEKLRLKGIVSGYKNADGSDARMYGPGDFVTYGQFAKLIQLLTERKPSSMNAHLHWAEPYVREARSMNMSVYLDERLNLDTPMSRGAVVRTLLEAYGISLQAIPQSTFTDLPADHPYANDLLTASALGIISGDENGGTVRPDAPVNRAEVAKILAEVSEKFAPSMKSSSSFSSMASVASSSSSSSEMLKPAANKDIRTVQTAILNVRSDARISASVLWIARQGMEMEVLQIIANDWAHIRVSDGNEGYVWVHHLR